MTLARDTYPSSLVTIQLEYDNAVPVGTYSDEFGTVDTYAVQRIFYINHRSDTFEMEVEGDNEFPRNFTVLPNASGDNGNIPLPQRFPNHPMTIKTRKV